MIEQPKPTIIDTEDTEPVGVKSSSEHWNQYILDDGTIIKTKSVLVEVRRAKTQKNELGEPFYTVKSAQLVDATVYPALKQVVVKKKRK